jgi:hypothetical protein
LFRNLLQNSRKKKVSNPIAGTSLVVLPDRSCFLRYLIWKQPTFSSIVGVQAVGWTPTDSTVRWIASDSRDPIGTVTDTGRPFIR